jgi:hypothetical protein
MTTERITERIPVLADPVVGIIMGSQSDWATMKAASDTLTALGVSHECKIVSAHRTPDRLFAYAAAAESRGLHVIIAGAGGAAHLPGMCAAKTALPVLGVPVSSKALSRPRLAPVHRADAARHPGRDPGDRRGRRDQRRAPGGGDRRAGRSDHPRQPGGLPRRPDRGGR